MKYFFQDSTILNQLKICDIGVSFDFDHEFNLKEKQNKM